MLSTILNKLFFTITFILVTFFSHSQNKITLKASNGGKTGFDAQKLRCIPQDGTIDVEYSGKGYLKAEVVCSYLKIEDEVKKILTDIETIYLVNKKDAIRGYPNYTLEFKYVKPYEYSFIITKRGYKE